MLTVLDEYTQALAVAVRTRMGADDVLEALYPLLLRHGTQEYITPMAPSAESGLAGAYPDLSGSPWENGYNNDLT